ncbi:MAG: transcription termination/antitermination protein NusA [Anaerolineales bacterium]|nr:transcription termination/antitermination protein NusA [Anaerolineales bacterium]
MKSELNLAFNEIIEQNKLKRDVIVEALENAMVTAYRKALNASAAQHVVAKVDLSTGAIKIYAEKEVVDSVLERNTEVTLADAREVDPGAKLGDMVTVEATPKDFGRIAAQAAKQVIVQRLREAERESQYQEYASREGDIVNGTVQAVSSTSITVGLGRTEATLPRNQTMPGERYYAHQKVRAFVLEVRKTTRGPQIILSRTHKNMLRRLLEYEVPEIYNGSVEIKSIARESGYRSKVAVSARQEGVDPVGACVGMRGVRIQSIVKELNDEKIDVIEWNPDQSTFIAKSLSPARVTAVYLDDDPISGRTAMVVVPDDQLSLAIGREGQNARLAAKLTNWRIDIKSLTEAATDAKNKIVSDVQYADLLRQNTEMIRTIEAILQRKAEGRPLAPEDYTLLAKLVEMVEKKMARGRQEERAAKVERAAAIKAAVPSAARRMPLAEAGLSDAAVRLLTEGDYKTVGEILEVMALDEKRLLEVEGFSNKHLEEVKGVLGKLEFPAEPDLEAPVATEETSAEPTAEAQLAVAEPVGEPVAAKAVATEGEGAAEAETEEEEDYEAKDDESEDDDTPGAKKKGKKKGKRRPAAEITYDEELGVYIKQKLRKSNRGGDLLGGEEE